MINNNIKIENRSSELTEINIEGIIGIPEEEQFMRSDNRIATYEKFRTQIENIKRISSPDIVVNIRSVGGNVNDALMIYETLTSLNSTITTRCYGYTASAATIIAQAATVGLREMSENALYLIHKSISTSEGNANNFSETVDLLEKTDERIASIYAKRSGKPIDTFLSLMDHNNGNGKWLSPQEAMEASLIDKIIPSGEDIKQSKLNAKEKKMTLKQHWNSIMEIMGLTDDKNPAQQTPTNEFNSPDNYQKQIEELHNKMYCLETENARLNALQTQTFQVEDPSPSEVKMSANTLSYEEDIRSFIK